MDYFIRFYAELEDINPTWIAAILTKEISTLDPADALQDKGLWRGDPTIGYAQSNIGRSRKNEGILREKGLLSRNYLYDGKTDDEIRGILLDKDKSPHVVAIQLKAVYLNNVVDTYTDPKEIITNTFAIYNNSAQRDEYGEKAYRYYEIWEWYYAELAKLTP